MKRAITIFPNLIRYQNNEPTGSYLKIIQALKLFDDSKITASAFTRECELKLTQVINNAISDLE